VKALASVPFPDFNLSVALLDDRASNANMDEPDPLPSLLPYLTNLHSLLQQCRFPAFWALYRSDALEPLRDNYTVEVVGFEDSIREVAVRAVKATFQKIGSKRLGSYLDLEGNPLFFHVPSSIKLIHIRGGAGRLYREAWVEI
jgi:translation initiation factor 3 subunit K